MVVLDWLEDPESLLVEWRYALEDGGVLFVMTPGVTTMLEWSAGNWDFRVQV